MTEQEIIPDTTGTKNEPGTPPETPKNEGNTIPKSRFDEVITQKKAAEERAEMWKSKAEEFSGENEEYKNKFESVNEELRDKDRQVWKSMALAKVNPNVARIASEIGVSFTGESQEEYDAWAGGLEQKLAPHLKEGDRSDVDGNRAGDAPTTITYEELMKLSPKERLKYTNSVLPRAEERPV